MIQIKQTQVFVVDNECFPFESTHYGFPFEIFIREFTFSNMAATQWNVTIIKLDDKSISISNVGSYLRYFSFTVCLYLKPL